MLCPICNNRTKVIDTVETKEGVKRRRCCSVCGNRFTTVEMMKSSVCSSDMFNEKLRNISNLAKDIADVATSLESLENIEKEL